MKLPRLLNRIGLGAKMACLCGGLALLTASVAAIGAAALEESNVATRDLVDRAIPLRHNVLLVDRALTDAQAACGSMLLVSPRSQTATELRTAREAAFQAANSRLAALAELAVETTIRDSVVELRALAKAIDVEHREILAILGEETVDARRDAVDQMRGSCEVAFRAARAEVDEFLEVAATEVEVASASMRTSVERQQWMIFGGAIVATLLACVSGFVFIASVRKPLVDTTRLLREMSQGDADFTRRLPAWRNDEFGELSRAFNSFVERQQSLIRQVVTQASALHASSIGLASIGERIESTAARTAQQTGSVAEGTAEIRSSLDAASQGVKRLADGSNQVRVDAESAASRSEGAVSTAATASDTMTKLAHASQEIGSVVKVISSIAEKTNLLALNATIEAARAGELGKGFAVVATEVKELAKGSGTATVDIERRINSIRSESDHAKLALDGVRDTIQELSRVVVTFADAARSQDTDCRAIANSVGEIVKNSDAIASNLHDLETIAKEGAECATEARESSAQLSAIADRLNSLVGSFRCD